MIKANEAIKEMDDTARAWNLKRCIDNLNSGESDFDIGELHVPGAHLETKFHSLPPLSKFGRELDLECDARSGTCGIQRPDTDGPRVLEDLQRLQGGKVSKGEYLARLEVSTI